MHLRSYFLLFFFKLLAHFIATVITNVLLRKINYYFNDEQFKKLITRYKKKTKKKKKTTKKTNKQTKKTVNYSLVIRLRTACMDF